jgi:hypothetical protein
LVRHRKNTTSAPAPASDPLAFLEKLSPAELQRHEENALARAGEREQHDLARKVYGIPENLDPVELISEEDQRLTDKAFERVVLPRKVEREHQRRDEQIGQLNQKLDEKDAQIQELRRVANEQRQEIKKLQGADLRKSSVLAILIRAAKADRSKNGLSLSAQNIAAHVDGKLKEHGLQLRHVSPKKWLKRLDLPRTLSGCLIHPDQKLRQAAKTIISRA